MVGRLRSPSRKSPSLGLACAILASSLTPVSTQAQSARFDEFTVTSPKAGEMAPDFTLRTVDNEEFNLMAVVAEMPVVMEFGSFT